MVSQFSAELTILKAFSVPLMESMDIGMGEGVPFNIPSIAEIEKYELERLRKFSASHFPGMKIHAVVKYCDPASAIEEEVKRGGIDLVMMPTHGHGVFRRLLLGSITTKVLHDVSCAVWTGSHAALAASHPAFPYKSIVCALDLTEEAAAVLSGAVALAGAWTASLHIVHTVETPPAAYEIDYGPFRKALMEAAEYVLREVRTKAAVDAPISVESGPVADVIRERVAAYHADVVVTGRGHAHDGASRVRSVLYEIIREAPCPVLSI